MKKSTKLGVIMACSAALFSLNSLLFNSEKVEAATVSLETLQENTGSWLPLNGAVDMTQAIVISGAVYADSSTLLNPGEKLGDANGILLTNLSSSQLSTGATGGSLGIGGLGSDTYFIGNNYSYNEVNSLGRYYTASVVAQGDGSSKKILSASTRYKYKEESGGSAFAMTWSNPVLNSNGTVTGTIGYTTRNNSIEYTTTTQITVQKSMSIGFMASTGGNFSEMKVKINSVVANKGTQPVSINYLNNLTGNELVVSNETWSSSIINANIGDVIGTKSQESSTNTGTNYDYTLPEDPIGYTHSIISNEVEVQNFPIGSKNPNYINVNYTPEIKAATLQFYYSKGTPGTGDVTDSLTGLVGGSPESMVSKVDGLAQTLPDSITTTGYYDSSLKDFIGDSGIPLGYEIDYVVGPDGKNGKIYPDLDTAMAANPKYEDIEDNDWANYFSVYLKARKSTTKFTYKYIEGTRPNAPTLPDPVVQTGVTGGVIADPTEAFPSLPKGSIIQDVIGPDGKRYSTLPEALLAEENKYFDIITKNFTLTVIAPPISVTLDDVPDLDFGTQELKGKPIYSISPQGAVGISDDTATNKGWSITANLIQQFTTDRGQSIKGATLTFDKGEVIPAAGNTSAPPITSEFILSEKGPVRVANAQANTGQGNWQLKFPNVSLNTYGSALVMNQEYQATIEWGISNVPE
ncbi:WxL domain-containing protein [Lactococcus garvieae]|uniref:WxL domain-containing protein n=1 Tax=Lactococcus garvieae TaxID=1363 RepID=UPI0038542420